jgi:methyl-accepting chemotaxis protein
MDQVTQENASLVEETAAAAQLLRDQAEELSQAVAAFTISGGQPARPAARRTAKVAPIASAAPRAPAAPAAKRPAQAKLANAKPASSDWEEF